MVIGAGALRRAWACSPALPSGPYVSPPDGQVGVPTNTRIIVEWDLGAEGEVCGSLSQIWLRAERGEVVSLPVRRGRDHRRTYALAAPVAPLAPRTRYEILTLRRPEDNRWECPAPDATPEPAASFTTGDGPDITPPVFAGVEQVVVRTDVCGYDCTCCGRWGMLLADLRMGASADETPQDAMRYNVYRAGEAAPIIQHQRYVTLGKLCWGSLFESPGPDVFADDGSYYARAVDLAGNVDDSQHTFELSWDCALADAMEPDAGVFVSDGGVVGVDGGSGGASEEGSCGCRASSSRHGWGLALALLLITASGRRRWRGRGLGRRWRRSSGRRRWSRGGSRGTESRKQKADASGDERSLSF